MGVTAKLYAEGSQLSGNMQNFLGYQRNYSQLGSYKYSAFSVLSILTILLDKCQKKSFQGNEH